MQQDIVSMTHLFEQGGFAYPVDELPIHPRFHTDEAAAHWIAKSESFRDPIERKFPGISDAKVTTWSLGQALVPVEKANVLSLGCRSGRADEHTLHGNQFQQACAASIFAKIAGIENDPALDAVLERVIREDRHGASNGQSIHLILKQIHRMETAPSIEEILEWVALAYEAQYQTFKKDPEALARGKVLTLDVGKEMISDIFGKETAEKWADLGRRAMKNAKDREERLLWKLSEDRGKGKNSEFWRQFTYARLKDGQIQFEKHWMVVIETKSYEVQRPAMRLGASLIIVKRPEGNMAIMSDKRLEIDLTTVGLALRTEELRLIRERGDATTAQTSFDHRALRARGHVTGWPALTPYWFLHDVPRPAANQLYNGSESAEMVPATAIPLSGVVKIVEYILGRKFHPRFYKDCREGKCAGRECPWFAWRLFQCGVAQGEVKLAESKTAEKEA